MSGMLSKTRYAIFLVTAHFLEIFLSKIINEYKLYLQHLCLNLWMVCYAHWYKLQILSKCLCVHLLFATYREADRILLQSCQERDPTETLFAEIAEKLQDKTPEQVGENHNETLGFMCLGGMWMQWADVANCLKCKFKMCMRCIYHVEHIYQSIIGNIPDFSQFSSYFKTQNSSLWVHAKKSSIARI